MPESAAREILDSIGAKAVAMKTGQQRRLLAVSEVPGRLHYDIDIRDVSPLRAMVDAFATMLVAKDDDVMRVVGPAPRDGEHIEIIMAEGPLRNAMLAFSRNVLVLSLIISAISAAPGLSRAALSVRAPDAPPHRQHDRVPRGPGKSGAHRDASARKDEIGVAERELAAMQQDLAAMLAQKSRLAALGLAVSKINHDLRNLLASAQLFSDRLSSLPDPKVQRFAPKLMRDARARHRVLPIDAVLWAGAGAAARPQAGALEALVEEVRETLGLAPDASIGWIVAIERGLVVDADHEQLFRVMLNLARNAVQALETRAPNDAARDQLRITGRREGAVAVIEVSDTGPGVAEKARGHLFEAFQASSRTGGSGLGLAIAAELIRAHGGEIVLVDGTLGATFRLTIPDRAVELNAHRSARAGTTAR